jgi:iron complex transport system substrate-binding protein
MGLVDMRIVSLLPAATEIVGALGRLNDLVGVSHECDYPPEVNNKPRITRCEIHGSDLPSADIDTWVRKTLQMRGTLYRLEEDIICRLQPDVILTQRLCDVCAVDFSSVKEFALTLPGPPMVVNLEPSSLSDILDNIRLVADAIRAAQEGERVVGALEKRIDMVRREVEKSINRPRCLLLEWIDPLYNSGHWGPELVEIAGGAELWGRKGVDSARLAWERVLQTPPDVIVLACCGYSPEQIRKDLPLLEQKPGWSSLPAVAKGRVYIVDASAYFSRPGPRIVDSLEILAAIIHPELFTGKFPVRAIQAPMSPG